VIIFVKKSKEGRGTLIKNVNSKIFILKIIKKCLKKGFKTKMCPCGIA
jgi:hypothetical protein